MSDDAVGKVSRDFLTEEAFLTDEADGAFAAGDREHCTEIILKLYLMYDARLGGACRPGLPPLPAAAAPYR